jgi:lysophospholipase L1-like esterase
MIKAYAEENEIPYVDYYSALVDDQGGLPAIYSKDGVHPNPDGYTVMEGVLMPILQKYVH